MPAGQTIYHRERKTDRLPHRRTDLESPSSANPAPAPSPRDAADSRSHRAARPAAGANPAKTSAMLALRRMDLRANTPFGEEGAAPTVLCTDGANTRVRLDQSHAWGRLMLLADGEQKAERFCRRRTRRGLITRRPEGARARPLDNPDRSAWQWRSRLPGPASLGTNWINGDGRRPAIAYRHVVAQSASRHQDETRFATSGSLGRVERVVRRGDRGTPVPGTGITRAAALPQHVCGRPSIASDCPRLTDGKGALPSGARSPGRAGLP